MLENKDTIIKQRKKLPAKIINKTISEKSITINKIDPKQKPHKSI